MILTPEQVRTLRRATGLSVSQFASTFPISARAMNAMEHEPDKNHRLREPRPKENEYLLRIAEQWHVDLKENRS